MSITIEAGSLQGIGVPKPLEIPATKYRQGGREMFHLTITLAQLTQLIPKRPDPNEPIEQNRKVDVRRAKRFGEYVLEREDWVSPAIIVRMPSGEFTFEPVYPFEDGTAWGVLKIPLHVLAEILLLDGQHRTLGTFLALDEVNAVISQARDGIEAAENNGDAQMQAHETKRLDRAVEQRERLNREHVSVDLAIVSTKQGAQMFVDIADNAKGVNPDFTSVLDRRDVVNRIAADLVESHPLLEGRVESGQTGRMSSKNPHFIGAKSVADIVRAVNLGVTGRAGKRIQKELTDEYQTALQKVSTFFDVLVDAFPELDLMIEGEIEPLALREEGSEYRSMIASATMLRVLAGVYRELTHPSKGEKAVSRSEVEHFFSTLAEQMRHIPVKDGDPLWMPTGAFVPGAAAPQARQGSLTTLVSAIVGWAREGNSVLGSVPLLEAAR